MISLPLLTVVIPSRLSNLSASPRLASHIVVREITFKTDPEKGDYELETGASRNFESWTDKEATEKKHKEARYSSTYCPCINHSYEGAGSIESCAAVS